MPARVLDWKIKNILFCSIIPCLQLHQVYVIVNSVYIVKLTPLTFLLDLSKTLYIRGEFNKFVELGIFLYNSRFLFSFLCIVNVCHLNDNSRSVNTYIFCSHFLFENLYP